MSTNADAIRTAYLAAVDSDAAWGDELRRVFGREACNVRYQPAGEGEPGSNLRRLYTARADAVTAWRTLAGYVV